MFSFCERENGIDSASYRSIPWDLVDQKNPLLTLLKTPNRLFTRDHQPSNPTCWRLDTDTCGIIGHHIIPQVKTVVIVVPVEGCEALAEQIQSGIQQHRLPLQITERSEACGAGTQITQTKICTFVPVRACLGSSRPLKSVGGVLLLWTAHPKNRGGGGGFLLPPYPDISTHQGGYAIYFQRFKTLHVHHDNENTKKRELEVASSFSRLF